MAEMMPELAAMAARYGQQQNASESGGEGNSCPPSPSPTEASMDEGNLLTKDPTSKSKVFFHLLITVVLL